MLLYQTVHCVYDICNSEISNTYCCVNIIINKIQIIICQSCQMYVQSAVNIMIINICHFVHTDDTILD